MKKYPVNFEISFLSNPYPGKFVALEGIDGSGKTTQAKFIVEQLQKLGHKAIYTQEPTDEETGKLIRKVLSDELKVPPVALQYLFNADRAVHLEKIKKLLQENYIVITDRYFWSAVAYGIADMQGTMDYYLAVFSMLSFYHQFILPDRSFYIDVKPEVAMRRIEKSKKHTDIYDKLEKLTKVHKTYAALIERFSDLFTVVNGDREINVITQEIIQKILSVGQE